MFNCIAFGTRLRHARKKAGYTMTHAAQCVYISQSVINGQVTPTIDRVCALAELYGCSVDWLLGRTKLFVCGVDLAREV